MEGAQHEKGQSQPCSQGFMSGGTGGVSGQALVTIIVPFAGVRPTCWRIMTPKMSEKLGSPWWWRNCRRHRRSARPRSSVPRRTPHLVVRVDRGVGSQPLPAEELVYDPAKDFDPADGGRSPNVLVVNPNVPAKDVKELVGSPQAETQQGDLPVVRRVLV